MIKQILGIRINRRAIAVALLSGETLTLSDGQYLRSIAATAVASAIKLVEGLFRTHQVRAVIIDSPTQVSSTVTSGVLTELQKYFLKAGLAVVVIDKSEVLAAYGVQRLRHRGDLRKLVMGYWPSLLNVRGRIQPYVADAAATALYGECAVELSRSGHVAQQPN